MTSEEESCKVINNFREKGCIVQSPRLMDNVTNAFTQ